MQKFKYINQSDQVYSNDLNQILVKTPPALYKYLLLTICAIAILSALILTQFRYSHTENLNCRVSFQLDSLTLPDSIQLTFLSPDKQLFDETESFSVRTYGKLITADTNQYRIPLAESCVRREFVYQFNDRIFEHADSIHLMDLGEVRPFYRYNVTFGVQATQIQTSNHVASLGTISLRQKSKRLYRKFI